MKALPRLLLTAFGLGRSALAPGTVGSLLPITVACVMLALEVSAVSITLVMLALAATFSSVCLAWGGAAERAWGDKDPSQIVADEVAGQALTLLALPWAVTGESEAWLRNGVILFTAFVSFRFFDITKPPPIMQLQSAGGGWGILLDDLIAGVYALIVTQAFARWILPLV